MLLNNPSLMAAMFLSVVGAVCVIMSRQASRKEGAAVKIQPGLLNFIGEQDGPREKTLKSALVEFFQGENIVQKAYLARLDIGEGHTVGLCLRTNSPPDESYPARIGELFIKVLGPGGELHVLFLTDMQESDLARVCRPFYDQRPA